MSQISLSLTYIYPTEEQSLIQAATTAAASPKVDVLPTKEEGPNNNNETTAIIDAVSEQESNVPSSFVKNEEDEATGDATTTMMTPVATSEAAKENHDVQNEKVQKATTTATLPDVEKEEENGGSSGVPGDDDDDDKVAVLDAHPMGEISASSATEAAQEESTVPVVVVEEEKAVVEALAPAETVSTTDTLKENNVITETTPQEKVVAAEASVLPVVADDVEVQKEEVSSSEQNEKDGKSVVTTGIMDGGVGKEEEEEEAQPSLESGVATTSNASITEKNKTSPTDTVVEATQPTPLVDVASSSIVTEDDENETSKPESCEAVITTESVNVKEEEVATTPVVETAQAPEEMTPEIDSKPESLSPAVTVEEKSELVIAESLEVRDEMNVPVVETKTLVASDVADANKIIEEAELQLHSDQRISAVDGAENMGGPLREKEQVTEPIVGVESPTLSAVTETEEPKSTGEGETFDVDTEDKPEHIPSECGGDKEEVPMPAEHENPDVPTATNTTEAASDVGKLEASNVQVVDNVEPCVDGVEKEAWTSTQPETPVASTQTTSKNIEIEEPALTSGVGEVPVEKVDHLAESDHKLLGSEIDHPNTDTSVSPEECPKGVDMKAAGESDELKTPAFEEQAACQPTSKEGVGVDEKTLSSTDQASIVIPPTSPDAPTTDTAQMMADEETSDITTNEKMETGEDIKKPGVGEDLEYSESHVSRSESQEASSSSADEDPTETSPDEEGEEEEPGYYEPIIKLKNATAMTRVLIPEDQPVQNAPIASRWGWSTVRSSGTNNMTVIGSDSIASMSSEKASHEKVGTASKTAWGLQTVGLFSFTQSTSEAEENDGQAKSDALTKDAEVVSKPIQAKDDEPALSEAKEPESSSTADAPVGSAAAATTSTTKQTMKIDSPKKNKKLTDIEKARLFAASILLESERVVEKEEKETTPKRFGSWF